MGARTIAVSDEVYTRLKVLKKPGESFSDLLNRLARPPSLLDLVGVMTPDHISLIEESVAEGRARSRARRQRMVR